jgi:hypothetical protein
MFDGCIAHVFAVYGCIIYEHKTYDTKLALLMIVFLNNLCYSPYNCRLWSPSNAFQINMQYCPPNVTLSEVWINHGISQCFMETLTVSITAGLLLLFGSAQLWMYTKYGTQLIQSSLPHSKLYYAQIFITFLLPVLAVVRFILQATILNGGLISGYMVSMVNGLCWLHLYVLQWTIGI